MLALYLLPLDNIYADGKKFVRSYGAYTLPANELELEFLYLNGFDKMSGSFTNYKPRFEIEYGIMDKLTASFYFNFNGTSASDNSFVTKPLNLESNSLELRYRFSELGTGILDPALYFEFEYGKNLIGYEPKIILSKEYRNFTGVLNVTSEFEKETDTNEKFTNFEITGGGNYKLTSLFSVGIEFRHSRVYENTFGDELAEATFIGPTINIHSEEFDLSVNLMRQLGGSPSTSKGLELMENVRYEFGAILEIEL
jgi:hypothetical protein